jgi:hypothetical protein
MKQHTYLRAYMAGIFVPTIFLIVVATAFCIVRYVYNLPVPVERVIVFPMAFVPNLWGLWNMLYVASHTRTGLSTGLHGALLPLVLAPLGILLTRVLDFPIVHHSVGALPIVVLAVLVAYYLVWKYIVGFLNGVLGVAQA